MAEEKPAAFREAMENLARLERDGRPVRAESLYQLLQFVLDGAYKLNRSLGQASMEVENPKELALAVCGVLEDAIQTLEDHEDGLRELTARSREECRALLERARDWEGRLEQACRALVRARQEEAQKAERQQALQREVGQLTQRIARLDEKSAFLRAERERLERDVQQAERNNARLLEQSERYAAIYTALNGALHDSALRESLFTLSGAEEALSVEAAPELGVAGVRIQSIEELDGWAAGVQAQIEGLIRVYQAQLQTIVELGEQVVPAGEN